MLKPLLATAMIILWSCLMQVTIPGPVHTGAAYADTSDVNPNGSSELSLLMRVMQKYTTEAREDVLKGNHPAPMPAGFDSIHTAKISDGSHKSDFYTQFSDLYLMSVKNYASSQPATRIETYNNMVAACLACHSQHCPGPVPAIRKMTIKIPAPLPVKQ